MQARNRPSPQLYKLSKKGLEDEIGQVPEGREGLKHIDH